MKSNLLERKDFYFDDEYDEYIKRQESTVEYWDSLDPNVGEALNEYRNDKKSYQFDSF